MNENSKLLLDLLTMANEIQNNSKVWFSKELDREIHHGFDRNLDTDEVMEELDIDSEHESKILAMRKEWEKRVMLGIVRKELPHLT